MISRTTALAYILLKTTEAVDETNPRACDGSGLRWSKALNLWLIRSDRDPPATCQLTQGYTPGCRAGASRSGMYVTGTGQSPLEISNQNFCPKSDSTSGTLAATATAGPVPGLSQ